MLDYYSTFKSLVDNNRVMSELFFRHCDQQVCTILEETLGYQMGVTLGLKPVIDLDGWDTKAMYCNLCTFNMRRLHGAYNLLKSGDFISFYAIVRIVFESFPKLFYCISDKEEARHIFCCEEYFYFKNAAQRSDKGIKSYCKSVKKPIDGKNCEYVKRVRWFRKEVYTKNRQSELNKTYALYSHNSHPNIEPIDARTDDDIKYGWATGLDIITSYSLMNLFILVNATSKELKILGKRYESEWFIKDRMSKVGDGLKKSLVLLYPDKDKYTNGLPFTLPVVDT